MSRRPSSQTVAVCDLFLASVEDWLHGYDISNQLGIASGTLYPILMRLSDRGHLETRWVQSDTPGRPDRHIYRLTRQGRRWGEMAVADATRRNNAGSEAG